MLLWIQQLNLLNQCQHESSCKQKEILPQQERRLWNIDFSLFELSMLVLEEYDEGDVYGGEEEERDWGESLLVEEGVEEERNIYRGDQHRIHRNQLHQGALLSPAISIIIIMTSPPYLQAKQYYPKRLVLGRVDSEAVWSEQRNIFPLLSFIFLQVSLSISFSLCGLSMSYSAWY